jgi:hypothetical protein
MSETNGFGRPADILCKKLLLGSLKLSDIPPKNRLSIDGYPLYTYAMRYASGTSAELYLETLNLIFGDMQSPNEWERAYSYENTSLN